MPATRQSPRRAAKASRPAAKDPSPVKEAPKAKKVKREEVVPVKPVEEHTVEDAALPKALQSLASMLGKPVAGMAKSKRVWKTTQTKRSSAMQQSLKRKSWDLKMAEKQKQKRLANQVAHMRAEKEREHQEAVTKMKEKRKRKEENEKKSQVVQLITDSRKLKRLSRKQLRGIVKR